MAKSAEVKLAIFGRAGVGKSGKVFVVVVVVVCVCLCVSLLLTQRAVGGEGAVGISPILLCGSIRILFNSDFHFA